MVDLMLAFHSVEYRAFGGGFDFKTLFQTILFEFFFSDFDGVSKHCSKPFCLTALTFLSTSSADLTASPPYLEVSPQLHDEESASDQCEEDEDSIRERQEAVAEAIEWGSSTRRNAGSRPGSDFFV
ncbi:hypothetical protein Droror1_Dr00021112 [Drosera rotundifolia]